jgi:hypothetical protein
MDVQRSLLLDEPTRNSKHGRKYSVRHVPPQRLPDEGESTVYERRVRAALDELKEGRMFYKFADADASGYGSVLGISTFILHLF